MQIHYTCTQCIHIHVRCVSCHTWVSCVDTCMCNFISSLCVHACIYICVYTIPTACILHAIYMYTCTCTRTLFIRHHKHLNMHKFVHTSASINYIHVLFVYLHIPTYPLSHTHTHAYVGCTHILHTYMYIGDLFHSTKTVQS